MKKSLLALAVLGVVAGTASAQSSVTIYGVLDQGIQKGNGGTATNFGAFGNGGIVGGPQSKAYHLRQSTPSRLGFRGNEDLGGGLSAQFQIEHRFTPDDGIASGTAGAAGGAGPFWAGRSYLQLTSATLGSFYMGRDYTPSFWIGNRADPFGQVGVGQPGATAQMAGFSTIDGAPLGAIPFATPGVRTQNTIGYKSPNFYGLTAQIAGSASENTGKGREYGANLEYNQGPIWAGVGYDKRTRTNAALFPLANNNSVVNIGAAYDFGFVRPTAYYARSDVGTNGRFTNTFAMVGLTAPLAGGIVKAMYSRFDRSDDASAGFAVSPGGAAVGATARPGGNDIKKLGLGYDYPLSKRTNLYADFGYAKEQGTTTGLAGGPGFTNSKVGAFGVKHTF